MLIGVINCYNDMPTIIKTVESMYPLVDQIVAVDGRYEDFPGEDDFSTDGTLEYLGTIDKVRIRACAGLLEADKRNLYLVGEEGDWYFHLDADEVWEGPLDIPLADMGICGLTQLKSGHTDGRRVRLFRHVEGLHYEGKHYWLKDGSGQTFALLDKPGKNYSAVDIPGRIIHHDIDRPIERDRIKKKYYRVLMKRENAIREVR